MADIEDDDRGQPWTLKGVRRADRQRIIEAARRADLTVAQWIVAASDSAIAAERHPIGQTVEVMAPEAGTALVAAHRADLAPDMLALREVLGMPADDPLVREARRTLRHRFRAMRGLM